MRFLTFATLVTVLPGMGIARLGLPGALPTQVLASGVVWSSACAWLVFRFDLPSLFWPLTLAPCLLLLSRKAPFEFDVLPGRGLVGLMVAVASLALVMGAARARFAGPLPDGSFALDWRGAPDDTFYASLAFEIARPGPDEVPQLGGIPLSYHTGGHLLRAAAFRFFDAQPLDSLAGGEGFFFGVLMIFLARDIGRLLGRGPGLLFAAPLAPLLCDWMWAVALVQDFEGWADTPMGGNLLTSIAQANTSVSAMVVAFGALLSLRDPRPSRGSAAAGCLLLAALPSFKFFTALHAVAVLTLWTVARPTRARKIALGFLAASTLLMTRLDAANRMRPEFEWASSARSFAEFKMGWEFTLAVAVVWVILTLGLRLLGIPSAVRALRSRSLPFALWALLGWPVGMVVSLRPESRMGDETFNVAAFYFLEHSGWLLSLFALLFLSLSRRPAMVWAACLLSVAPGVFEFAIRPTKDRMQIAGHATMEAVRAVRDLTPENAIVSLRYRHGFEGALVCAVSGRRIAIARFWPYLPQFAEVAEIERRIDAQRRFFTALNPQEASRAVAGLGATHLLVFTDDVLEFDPGGFLPLIYENSAARLFKLP